MVFFISDNEERIFYDSKSLSNGENDNLFIINILSNRTLNSQNIIDKQTFLIFSASQSLFF